MLLEDSILPLAGGGFNAEGSPLEPALRRRYRMGIQKGELVSRDYQKAHLWMVLAISRDGLSPFLNQEFLDGGVKALSLSPEKMYNPLARTIEKGHLSMPQLDQNFRLINEWLEKLVLSPEDLDWEEYRKSKGERIRSDNAYLFEEILG